MMTLLELVTKEGIHRQCKVCGTEFTDNDWADYYCKVCQSCFTKWEEEAGASLARYVRPTGERMCVCAPCGMVFSSLSGFDIHRKGMKCNSPAEMNARKRPLVVRNGMWAFPPPQECHYLPDQLS